MPVTTSLAATVFPGLPPARRGAVRGRPAFRASHGPVRRWLLGLVAMAMGVPGRAGAQGGGGPLAPQSFAYGPGPDQELDLFHPGGPGARPLVVFVHGGGWDRGSRKGVRPAVRTILEQGWALASVDYPLSPEAPLEDQVRAVSRAIAFLQDRAAELRIDPARVVLVGFSAGANVAMLSALRRDLAPDRPGAAAVPRVRLVIGLDGVGYDVVGIMRQRPNHPRLVPVFGRDPERWARLSPVALVQAAPPGSVPPVVLANGDHIFSLDAAQFEAALKARGVPVARHEIPGLGHGEFLRSLLDPNSPLSRILRQALASV